MSIRIIRSTPKAVAAPLRVLLLDESAKKVLDPSGVIVNESIRVAGLEFRSPRHKRLPLLTNGDNSTVRNIVGSVYGIVVDRGQVYGVIHWASDAKAKAIAKYAAESNPFCWFEIERLECVTPQAGKRIVTRWAPLHVGIRVPESMQ
jgi:hypothetical protein